MPVLTLTASVPAAAAFQHAVGRAIGLPTGTDATLAQCQQWLRDQAEALNRQIAINEGVAQIVVTPLSLT